MTLQLARTFNQGGYFARGLLSWEKSWVSSRTIEEGKCGAHPKTRSHFDDEEVQLSGHGFVGEKYDAVICFSGSNYMIKASNGLSVIGRIDDEVGSPLVNSPEGV
ncbi:hypothetical protein K470DRAFT_144208 [Piedraia hortae CBS 480.64]|uniref:Uncharacterized protein n=1 Tax=Piedraia hortae CBS 480.64 TaxID=1314780 RepID=A0A6A7BSW0_9PEZI|nr:hypothetical protein K470DRAFT_144208 [Piedraia hortae CBS 480.64]